MTRSGTALLANLLETACGTLRRRTMTQHFECLDIALTETGIHPEFYHLPSGNVYMPKPEEIMDESDGYFEFIARNDMFPSGKSDRIQLNLPGLIYNFYGFEIFRLHSVSNTGETVYRFAFPDCEYHCWTRELWRGAGGSEIVSDKVFAKYIHILKTWMESVNNVITFRPNYNYWEATLN